MLFRGTLHKTLCFLEWDKFPEVCLIVVIWCEGEIVVVGSGDVVRVVGVVIVVIGCALVEVAGWFA